MPTIANVTLKEPLMNSGPFSCTVNMHQIKTPISGNSQSIAKIGNVELADFNKQMLIHELIRGSLESSSHQCRSKQQESADRHQRRQQGV